MSRSIEKVVDKAFKYGAAFAEVSSPTSEKNKTLTAFSCSQFQKLPSLLPGLHLKFVLGTGISEAEVTLDGLALAGTKQV